MKIIRYFLIFLIGFLIGELLFNNQINNCNVKVLDLEEIFADRIRI